MYDVEYNCSCFVTLTGGTILRIANLYLRLGSEYKNEFEGSNNKTGIKNTFLELSFGNPTKALNQIEEFTSEIIKDNKIPCMIGGEHLVTLGAVRAVAKKYTDLHIIHFDAHADLRDDYLGEKLSHATVMHRVWDIVGDNKIFQFGIRSCLY